MAPQRPQGQPREVCNGWHRKASSGKFHRSPDLGPWRFQWIIFRLHLGGSILADYALNIFIMLFDAASNRLTALLDFDLSHTATPADEYFYSFRTVGALLAGPFEEGDEGQLRRCLLDGFDGNVPKENGTKVNFDITQMMDKELVRAGVLRPSEIWGAGELAGLKWFLEDVSPPYFFMSRWLAHMDPERVGEMRMNIEENLESTWKDGDSEAWRCITHQCARRPWQKERTSQKGFGLKAVRLRAHHDYV